MPLFTLSFLPMALNLIYTAFLFSTKRTGAANAIALSRGIFLKAAAIFFLPLLFGTDAVWIAPFFAELITLVLSVILSKKTALPIGNALSFIFYQLFKQNRKGRSFCLPFGFVNKIIFDSSAKPP